MEQYAAKGVWPKRIGSTLPTSPHNSILRTNGGYMLDRKFHTVEVARAFAERLGKPLTRYEFFVLGFKVI